MGKLISITLVVVALGSLFATILQQNSMIDKQENLIRAQNVAIELGQEVIGVAKELIEGQDKVDRLQEEIINNQRRLIEGLEKEVEKLCPDPNNQPATPPSDSPNITTLFGQQIL